MQVNTLFILDFLVVGLLIGQSIEDGETSLI